MKSLKIAAAYLLWLVNALFGIWLIFICRNTWLAIFNQYYINGSPMRADRAGLLDRLFSILLGLLWFGLVIIFETYFRNSVAKNTLMKHFAKGTAPIVLAIFGVDLILALIQGFAIIGWLRFFILLVELVLGLALARLGWMKTVKTQVVGQARGTN